MRAMESWIFTRHCPDIHEINLSIAQDQSGAFWKVKGSKSGGAEGRSIMIGRPCKCKVPCVAVECKCVHARIEYEAQASLVGVYSGSCRCLFTPRLELLGTGGRYLGPLTRSRWVDGAERPGATRSDLALAAVGHPQSNLRHSTRQVLRTV